MRIAAGRIVLDFYGNDHKALKHRKIEELCKDLRKKYNLSALEIDDFDDPEKCVLGFAAVISNHWETEKALQFLHSIQVTLNQISPIRVTVEDCELLEFR